MSMSLRSSRARIRSLAPALLLAVVFLGSADSLLGQVTTGLGIIKSCPPSVAAGSAFQCTFSVQNLDPDVTRSVTNLAVTNQVPFPGGPITPLNCLNVAGQPVNGLGPHGTANDTCHGTIDETAPACGPAIILFVDQVSATGDDGPSPVLPVSASTTNLTQVAACPPDVPTLSFPMMALLGLLLAGGGFFLARRQ